MMARDDVRQIQKAETQRRMEFLRGMLGELRDLALADQHAFLSYMIEMAYVEASDILREGRKPTAGSKAA